MRYYSLEHEVLKKGIGPSPQSERMADHYHYKKADSIWNLTYDNDFIPNLNAIQLVPGAKLLDMLSVVVISPIAGKMISEELVDLVRKFQLPRHRFIEAKVWDDTKHEVEKKKYFLFRVLEHQNQFINFDRSEFYIHKRGEGDIGSIDIKNARELEFSSEERGLEVGQFVRPRFITLFPDVNFDIFSFRRFAGFYVSEKLKTAIEIADLTGICFKSADFILHEQALSFKS